MPCPPSPPPQLILSLSSLSLPPTGFARHLPPSSSHSRHPLLPLLSAYYSSSPSLPPTLPSPPTPPLSPHPYPLPPPNPTPLECWYQLAIYLCQVWCIAVVLVDRFVWCLKCCVGGQVCVVFEVLCWWTGLCGVWSFFAVALVVWGSPLLLKRGYFLSKISR